MEIVLASGSKYKKQLLERLGLPFTVAEAPIDESRWKIPGRDPAGIARELANAKAAEALKRFPEAVVIGADQMIERDGIFFSKPVTVPRAVEQLKELSGRKHQVCTAVSVRSQGHQRDFVDITRLAMRPLTIDQIERYIAQELPLDSAGSYHFEGKGIRLFESIETQDPTAVIGLPLIRLTSVLAEFGFPLP